MRDFTVELYRCRALEVQRVCGLVRTQRLRSSQARTSPPLARPRGCAKDRRPSSNRAVRTSVKESSDPHLESASPLVVDTSSAALEVVQ